MNFFPFDCYSLFHTLGSILLHIMSEIFLKLRIKEMLEGKMKGYLIFGIVEILLVLAGILKE